MAFTSPAYWFLPDRKNPDAALQGIKIHTSGNLVEPLIDGKTYMKKLHDTIKGVGAGDYICIAGLEVRHDILLDPTPLVPTDTTSSLLAVLINARMAEATVRILLSGCINAWINPGSDSDAQNTTRRPVNYETYDKAQSNGLQCVLDERRGGMSGTIHQKFAVIYNKPTPANPDGLLHGFCGGIDLTDDRWDTSDHDYISRSKYVSFMAGWHDVHAYVLGPAARDLDICFRERWNSLIETLGDTRRPCRMANYTKLDTPVVSTAYKEQPGSNTHSVQILRTYPCGAMSLNRDDTIVAVLSEHLSGQLPPKDHEALPFATHGEMSARYACLQAIRRAQHSIYIEDQYFQSREISEHLLTFLKGGAHRRVIVLTAREPSADAKISIPYQNFYHDRAIKLIVDGLQGVPGAGKFAIYELRSTVWTNHPVYVHAKLMIIDDCWVQIGSMNCNRRSMTNDAELCIAVVGSELLSLPSPLLNVCRFANDLRMTLWAEHLGLTPTQAYVLTDPLDGFEIWKSRAGGAGTVGVRAVEHQASANRPSTQDVAILRQLVDMFETQIDIQGHCPSADQPRIEAP